MRAEKKTKKIPRHVNCIRSILYFFINLILCASMDEGMMKTAAAAAAQQ